mgnify:CR=1 FL=1
MDLISSAPLHDQDIGYGDLSLSFHEELTREWGWPEYDVKLGTFHLNFEYQRIYTCTSIVTKIDALYGVEIERTWVRVYSIRYEDDAEYQRWMRGGYRVVELI